MKYIKLSQEEFSKLIQNSKIIQDGRNGPKVLELPDKQYFKIFRLKSYFSSAIFHHYASRFYTNSLELNQKGIKTVVVSGLYLLPKGVIKNSITSKAVQYEYLPGKTIRHLIENNLATEDILIGLARFMAKLHYLGIYFKAAHMGNIVYNPDFPDHFGLIDIDNIKFFDKPLSDKYRQTNFGHMNRYEQDKKWLDRYSNLFHQSYSEHF